MSNPVVETDVAVIGAGPIGLELAVALKGAGVDYVQLDAGPVGATIAWWAPGTQIFSSPERIAIAGVPLVTPDQVKATREQYLMYLRSVVKLFDLDVRAYERVMRIECAGDGFVLTTVPSRHGVGGPAEASREAPQNPATAQLRCRRLVLAIGNLHRPRLLGVPGEDLPHVSHFLGEPHGYFGCRVLVVGGKNSAVEAALRLYRVAADVTMSYRGDTLDPRRVKYWLRPEIEWLFEKGRIGWRPGTAPIEILADHVRLSRAGGVDEETVAADSVLLLTGYVQDAFLFDELGLERSAADGAPVLDLETMEASVPGVFVAGTAIAGSERRTRVYIENSHVHVERIVRALTGKAVSWSCDAEYAALEES